jgi:hypothetical protein
LGNRKITISGGGKLTQDPTAHVTWIVDRDITVAADSYNNWSNRAANAEFVGVGTGKISISGYGNFIATLQAPGRDVTVSGGAALSGSVVDNTLTLTGSSSMHRDEAQP